MAALLPDGRAILMTVYLAAITPACTTITSMVQLYGQDAGKSSALYVMSTLLFHRYHAPYAGCVRLGDMRRAAW